MRDLILSIPAQLATGIELGTAHRVQHTYRRIISCGMGGSAIAGEMLSMVQPDIVIHWDYDLPENCTAEDLVICTSWSGSTEETISSYKAARALGAHTLVITAGGELATLARTDNTPLIEMPHTNSVPRTNPGVMAGALFAALGVADLLPTTLDAAALEPQGKELAGVFGGRMLVAYSAYPWRKLTGFWKMAYSETAKRQVMVNWFPSGAHNEVVGWEGPYKETAAFLLLRDETDTHGYTKNFDALLAILAEKGYTVTTVALSGDSILEKVFNSYLVALWTSYHVALLLGIDPQATELLDEFKRKKAQA
jgi:glucose/mannose-6-phosphate isomerase